MTWTTTPATAPTAPGFDGPTGLPLRDSSSNPSVPVRPGDLGEAPLHHRPASRCFLTADAQLNQGFFGGGGSPTRPLHCPHEHLRTRPPTLTVKPASIGDYRGKALLVVNVASKCGLTPQYEGLERLQKTYADKGFTVLGFPCNQFGEQEPGSAEEIATFCSTDLRGHRSRCSRRSRSTARGAIPVYDELTAFPDADGEAGDIQWNFEKFLVSPNGEIVQRFRPMVDPEAPEVIDAIEAALPADRGPPSADTPAEDQRGDMHSREPRAGRRPARARSGARSPAACEQLGEPRVGAPDRLPGLGREGSALPSRSASSGCCSANPHRRRPRQMPDHVRNPFGEINEAWVGARRPVPGDEMLAEFVETTATSRGLRPCAMSPEEFDVIGPSPIGQVPYREFMETRVIDSWAHEQDVRRALGRPGGRNGPGEADLARPLRARDALRGRQASCAAGRDDGPIRRRGRPRAPGARPDGRRPRCDSCPLHLRPHRRPSSSHGPGLVLAARVRESGVLGRSWPRARSGSTATSSSGTGCSTPWRS